MGDVVVAGAMVRHGRILLCHRSALRRWFPDVWDLPGGHVEPGEEPTGALCRELDEELGVTVFRSALESLDRIRTDECQLDIWLVRHWRGTPRNVSVEEHDAIGWFGSEKLPRLALAHPTYESLLPRALGCAEG